MAGTQLLSGTDSALRAATAHPLRTHLFILLTEKIASPKELAAGIGGKLSNVSYHVKVLHKAGAIELVRKAPGGRNSTEHFYVATERSLVDDEATLAMTVAERVAHARAVAQLSAADLARALDSYVLGLRHNHHMSRVPMQVDEEGTREVSALLKRTLAETMAIQTRCADRLGIEPPGPGDRFVTSEAVGIPVRVNLQFHQVPG